MDFEEDSLQEHLLNVYDSSPTNTQVLYKLLLDALRSKDFRSFKNTMEYNLRKQSLTLNVNYVYPNHSDDTCLDIASRNGLTEFVEFLLRKGAKPNRVNEEHNRAPIHFATESGHVETLAALLAEPTINPNLEAGQQTALHIAVKKKDLECADLLLEKGASASIPNSKGLTALHLAAIKSQCDMAELILVKCRQSPDVDSYRDYNGQTTREVIQQKLPRLLLPPKCEKRKVNAHDLKYYLIANDETNFLRSLELVKVEVLHGVAEDLLEMVAQRDFCEAAARLLERLKGSLFSVRKAAYVAVQQGRHIILRQLLSVEPEVASDLIIDACSELGMPEKREVDNTFNRLECLKLILEQENVDVRCTDDIGNTPLHYAARAGCREAVTLLLNRGSYIGHMNNCNVPPIADIPICTLSRYFDDCLKMRRERKNAEYAIEFNYRCLMPHGALMEQKKGHRAIHEMEIFKYIACNYSLKHLLKHPLLSSFLYLKWHRIQHILYANFAFYTIFYSLLIAYIFGMTYDSPANENEMRIVNDSSNMTLGSTLQIAWYQNGLLWAFAMLLLLFIFQEILQFVSCSRHYLANPGNWLKVTLIALTFVLLCGVRLPVVDAVVILLSAWEMVILIGQHPRISTSIEMFRTVSFNFIRFFFPYMFLIVAFALAFYTLFKDSDDTNFLDLGRSFFKTIIMFTGEFDANDIPFISCPVWSHIVFVLFVFIIVIVLFNVLNGLAVSDIAEILCKAELVGLISRIRLLSYIEDVAVSKPFRHCLCDKSRSPRWNPFGFLARRILLFPNYLSDCRISIKYDNLDTFDNDRHCVCVFVNWVKRGATRWTTLEMDPNIIKQAKRIISEKHQLSENERIMVALNELQERLEAAMESVLNTVKLSVKNNNVNDTMKSAEES